MHADDTIVLMTRPARRMLSLAERSSNCLKNNKMKEFIVDFMKTTAIHMNNSKVDLLLCLHLIVPHLAHPTCILPLWFRMSLILEKVKDKTCALISWSAFAVILSAMQQVFNIAPYIISAQVSSIH